ncbi:hypothetical protein M408DRAFT_218180 [Serendipita vermifera MAFF 305830]|uniref:Uncharacterized protein n=1 Tax=Serendipita vermifera MAFF 305830 TaxID=933852 RepID=A0A0C3B6E1_SERVB|nr:hypothetical protein M408DRAFT_218180 [Serendipita vermifera MAFF 305830]
MSTLPIPKTPEMRTSNTVKIFNWGSKPTKTSDAPRLDLQFPSSSSPLDSFNLRSFRPVRPVSPSTELDLQLPPAFVDQPRSQSPASLAPPSPIGGGSRPRVSSIGSENSQKITVAQFRQAQLESAKNRSSVHLPVPEHPSDAMPPGNVPLHVARPPSPNPGMAIAAAAAANSGNESGGDGAAPSRPGRLLPPQAMGRSSPIPRERTPVSSSASPRSRPVSSARPLENAAAAARLSAKWMVDSEDSDTNSSEDSASDDAMRWPSKKPPLISDFRKLKGGANSPKPEASPTNAYPSSFASASKTRLGTSASKSDLGHDSSSTARQHLVPRSPASTSISTPPRPHSSFTLSSSPTPKQNIKPGQYSTSPSPTATSPIRSPSVMTHGTGESVDVWSNTHSAAHSRQGSSDQLFKQGQKGVAKSEMGHGDLVKRSAGIRRAGTTDSLAVPGSSPVVTRARSQSTNVITQTSTITSSFSAAKVNPKTVAPVATDTEDDEHPSSTEDDEPLSSLVPPRRPGSNLSSHGSGSPVNSVVTLPIRAQSPALSARSAATTAHIPRSPSNGIVPVTASRSDTASPIRKGSANSSTSPSSQGQSPDPKSPRSRGRKPLIDLTSSEPTVVASSPKPINALPSTHSSQASLLTPPISEQGFSSPSPTEAVPKAAPAPIVSSFKRPAPSAIQRSHDHIIRPFTREDSPASSIGNSSVGSGLYPNTPGTGSDAGASMRQRLSTATSSSGSSGNDKAKNSGGKRLSVTFDESPIVFTEKKSLHHRRGASGSSIPDETDTRRNERRRSEARASIELGRVVNGPPPVDPDDEPRPIAPNLTGGSQNWNMWQQQQQQQQQMQAMAMNMNMNMGPGTPGMSPMNNMMFNPMQMQMNMGGGAMGQQMFNMSPMGTPMGMPMGFNMPPVPTMPNMMMGMDPAMMMAHQQAMAVAKQAYQMAVAQQAMAAAGDEWERSSNMGGFGGGSRPPTLFGMPSSGSVYGGGSMLGVNMPTGGNPWGGSVYGEAFGPSQPQHDWRQSGMGAHSVMGVDDEVQRGQGRKRTLTAPSSALPPAHLRGAGAPPMPPPSSWRPS